MGQSYWSFNGQCTDSDKPDAPILTLREARIALYLKTFWTVIHVITCVFIIANVIRHW